MYLTFVLLILMLVLFAYESEVYGSDWNILSISIDNFVQMHVTMLLILRLVKLHRFRLVFWYFIAVAILAILLEDVNNRYF